MNASGPRLLRPTRLSEALRMLRDEGPLRPLAGATDLYVGIGPAGSPGESYLDLSRLGALRRIEVRGERLLLGAMVTFSQVGRSRHVARRLPMLAAAARLVGGVQIQNRATLGGNIANASPAADSVPPLVAAGALLHLRRVGSERRVAVEDFYRGYKTLDLEPDELIVAIEVPPIEGRQWFRKVGTRAAQAISKVVAAGVRGDEIRFALGSVGPTVVRARNAEACLEEGGALDKARRALARDIGPIDDVRSTARYRRHVADRLLLRFWEETS